MKDIPNFFQPNITRTGNLAKVICVAWDKNGALVPLALGARLGPDEEDNKLLIEALRHQAWQAVWLTAQTDSTTNTESPFRQYPEDVPVFASDAEPDPQP